MQQGNRSSSSACGSADVLEALGVVIDLGPEGIKRCVEESGIAFMMSPMYHPAMKIVGPVRKKLKIKTVFNVLGPMLNPARVSYAVVGVYHKNLVHFLPLNQLLFINNNKKTYTNQIPLWFIGSEDGKGTATVWYEKSIGCSFIWPRRNESVR